MKLKQVNNAAVVHHRLSDSEPRETAHSVGIKKILLKEGQSAAPIPQIAVAFLKAGDSMETHNHETMEEFFYCLVGKVEFTIGGVVYDVNPSELLVIPMGVDHSLHALLDSELFYWGVSSKRIIDLT